MSDKIDAIDSTPSWELDSVKDEWYKSRDAFGLQYLDFSRMNGRIELILMEEQGTHSGQDWRHYYADYLISNNHLDMLGDKLTTPDRTLRDLYYEYMAKGSEYDQSKNWHASILTYRKAIAAWPKEATPYYGLGIALMQTSEYEAAVTHLYVALSLLPDTKSVPENRDTFADGLAQNFWIHYVLACNLHKLGRMSEAVEQYKVAYSLSPSEESADNIFSALDGAFWRCLADEDWEIAILLQHSKHDLRPNQLQLHTNLSSIYKKSGDLVSAKREAESAVYLFPNDATALANLAPIYASIGDYEKAISIFERSLAIEPSEAKMRSAYAYSLLMAGKHSDGILQIEEALKIDPQDAMALDLRLLLVKIGIKTN